MKTSDLMIEDWVMSRRYPSPSRVYATYLDISKDQPTITIINEEEGKSIIAGHFIEELTPIPLTQEILEKNGFTLFNQYKNNIVYHYLIDDIQQNSIFITIVDGTEIYYSYKSNDDYDVISFLPIQYVHELQHALKICKIDKEIIL